MINSKSILVALIPVSFVAAAMISSATSRQDASSPAVGHAESLSTAFRNAADEVLPTVVKIQSRVEARRIARRRNPGGPEEDPFRGTPFEGFFGDEPFSGPLDRFTPKREGTGSGVIVDESGLILTNNHVVAGADEVIVELADGRKIEAVDIRTDPQTDLAIIRIEGAGQLKAARLGDSDAMRIGDWVLAVGNPFELEASVSAGIISAKGRSLESASRASFLQTDAAINPGNSGGPLVNLRGEVIGINTAIASSSGGYQGIGFAIPVNLAKWVSDQLVDSGSVRRAWLGIKIYAVDQDVAETLGIDVGTKGVVVQFVGDNTPAAKAGVRPMDVITHFGGQAVASSSQLQRAVERAPLDSRQALRVIRRGREIMLNVRTEALPDAEQNASARPLENDEVEDDALFGIRVVELEDDVARRMGLDGVEGVFVARIGPGSIARASGLQRGMVIQDVNGTRVSTPEEFKQAIEAGSFDRGITLTVRVPGEGAQLVILKRR